jgi:hypothetical protein
MLIKCRKQKKNTEKLVFCRIVLFLPNILQLRDDVNKAGICCEPEP